MATKPMTKTQLVAAIAEAMDADKKSMEEDMKKYVKHNFPLAMP